MRASAVGRVAWNGASADYSISEQTREVAITSAMNFESEVWQAWLERIPSFAFHGRDGQRFTARKETRARGGSYWVAYRKFGGKLTHTYLRMRRKPGKDAMAGYLDRVLAAFPPQSKIDQRALQQPLPEPLSAREQEVLSLLARGASNQEIAEMLVVALDTVKRHVSNILSKLAVNNRTQAVVRARALGLLSEEV